MHEHAYLLAFWSGSPTRSCLPGWAQALTVVLWHVQTYIGSVLVSVNPFKGLPIYTDKFIEVRRKLHPLLIIFVRYVVVVLF